MINENEEDISAKPARTLPFLIYTFSFLFHLLLSYYLRINLAEELGELIIFYHVITAF